MSGLRTSLQWSTPSSTRELWNACGNRGRHLKDYSHNKTSYAVLRELQIQSLHIQLSSDAITMASGPTPKPLGCSNAKLRQLARRVSQHYDHKMGKMDAFVEVDGTADGIGKIVFVVFGAAQ